MHRPYRVAKRSASRHGPRYGQTQMKKLLLFLLTLLTLPLCAADRPNILWITSEDNGPQLGCYGDKYADTPNLDRLAAKGLRFEKVWSVAPVCAPARTAIITGLYPSSSGALHMRSQVKLPADMKLFPEYLREAGYYCTNQVKEDYNVETPRRVWDESSKDAHYKNRAAGQPFFAVFNFMETHESQVRKRPHKAVHDPAAAPLPPWWPDTPEVRQDWAQYYDNMTVMDRLAGKVLDELTAGGLAENTIVFYFGDHGPGMPRCKRTASDSGLRVPMIVHFPDKWKHLAPHGYKAGGSSTRLVSFVDLAPTLLSLAGVPVPSWMQGRAFAGAMAAQEPEYLYGMRDRMDERYDMVRSVRDQRYVYVRNYSPHRAGGQRNAYMFQTPATQVWHGLFTEGKLNEVQAAYFKPHPPEELFDLESDPYETKNLAGDPAAKEALERMRAAHVAHLRTVRDVCLLPEAEMLRRAEADSPYTMGHDDSRFPLEAVLKIAQRATSGKASDIPELRDALSATDAAIRWWAAMGHRMHGKEATAQASKKLAARLNDENPSVRIAAAEALALYGSAAESSAALEVLLASSDCVKNDFYDAVRALNALEDNKSKLAPYAERLQALPRKRPGQAGRVSDYAARMLEHLARPY
jgi:arylsulfatase A-like enzyme